MLGEKATLTILSKTELAIELRDGKTPVTSVNLGANAIDPFTVSVATLRATMTPEIVRKLPDGQHPGGIVDPMWVVPSHPAAQEKVLFLRHPGLGWLSFLFPQAECRKLGMALLAGQSLQTGDPNNPSDLRH